MLCMVHVHFGGTLQRDILNPLAIDMLEGNFHDGDAVAVDFADDKFVFSVEKV